MTMLTGAAIFEEALHALIQNTLISETTWRLVLARVVKQGRLIRSGDAADQMEQEMLERRAIRALASARLQVTDRMNHERHCDVCQKVNCPLAGRVTCDNDLDAVIKH